MRSSTSPRPDIRSAISSFVVATLCSTAAGGSIASNARFRCARQSRRNRVADDGQLYAYEALSPGQRFWARLESDDVGLLTKVKDALLGEAFVGRSKTAEFGRVRIEAVEPWGDDIVSTTAAATGARFIWLLSDSWFLGVDGLPTGRPEPEISSAARIDWSRSFRAAAGHPIQRRLAGACRRADARPSRIGRGGRRLRSRAGACHLWYRAGAWLWPCVSGNSAAPHSSDAFDRPQSGRQGGRSGRWHAHRRSHPSSLG